MNLPFFFAFFLVYAVVRGIPLLNVSISTASPFHQEHKTLQQRMFLAHSQDKNESNHSNDPTSDNTIHGEGLPKNSSYKVTEQTESPTFKRMKSLYASKDSGNVTQNTTDFAGNTTTPVFLAKSTLDCRQVECSAQKTTTFPSAGKGEVQPQMNQKKTTSNVELKTSCSAEPSQRVCGCTSTCTKLNNCCYDSEYDNSDQESVGNNTKYSCHANFGQKWTLPSPSRLIDECLPAWEDDSVRQRCEAPDLSDFKSYIPCHSPETDLVYKNVYCLQCNGLINFRPWELTFRSSHLFKYDYIDTFAKVNKIDLLPNRGVAQFLATPEANQEPVHCLPSTVQSCDGQFNNNLTLSKLCQAYYDPVIVDRVPYRNIYCLKCSTNQSSDKIVRVERQRSAYSTFLKFATPLQSQGKKCSESTCLPTVSRIWGYTESFPVSVTIVNRDRTAINASTMSDVRRFWQDKCVKKTQSELAGFNTFIGFDFDTEFSLNVKILEEIRPEQVPEIRKSVRSVSLYVHYSDTVTISCHVIQLEGESPTPGTNETGSKTDSNFMNYVNAAESTFAEIAAFLVCLVFLVSLK